MIVVYKMNSLSYFIARKKVRVPWISLVNLVLDRLSVSEYIQDFKEKEIVDEALKLLTSSDCHSKMLDDFDQLRSLLSEGGSFLAADHLYKFLKL